jgi:hypothetical protein
LAGGLAFREGGKYDLDSEAGQTACKAYLDQLEKVYVVLQIKVSSKAYRESFSKAYKVLY